MKKIVGYKTFRVLPATNAKHSVLRLSSNEQYVVEEMLGALGTKSFLIYHAQGFEQAPIIKAYQEEENRFGQTVGRASTSNVSADFNVITSNGVYKLQTKGEKPLSLKASIAPHLNEDSQRSELRTECCMCPSAGLRSFSLQHRYRVESYLN